MVPIHDFHLIGVELGSCLNGAESVFEILSRRIDNGWVYSRMLTAGEDWNVVVGFFVSFRQSPRLKRKFC